MALTARSGHIPHSMEPRWPTHTFGTSSNGGHLTPTVATLSKIQQPSGGVIAQAAQG